MRFALPLFTVAALALAAAAQAAPSVPIKGSEPIASAKAKLRDDGWRPRNFARYAPSDAMDTFRKEGYTETEQCSNDEYFCVLDYVSAHGACLRIVADYSTLKPLKAWVTSWTFECPNPELLKAPPEATH